MSPNESTHPAGLTVGIKGLAKLLGISRSLACKLDASGRLPRGIYLGRRKVWSVAEIEAWLAAGAPTREVWEAQKASRDQQRSR